MECKKFIFLLTATFLLLTGCSYNPFVPKNDLTGNLGGAAVGAGVGSGLAWFAGASKGIIAAAGLGGAALGYYVTTLTFASAGLARGCGQVFTLGCFASVDIPSDSLFEPNTAEFLEDACPILDSAVAVMSRYPNNNIIVSGNTSGFASNRFERKLSEARARQVSAYLWMHGIGDFLNQSFEMRKLTYVGYGSYFPVANQIRNRAIRQNSHIQITAYPTDAQLYIDKRSRTFNNIGAMADSCAAYSSDESACQTFAEFNVTKQGGCGGVEAFAR